jgi:cytochrome c-type biogenesis protein CcmF
MVERRLPERTMLATLAAQAFVSLGFYAFLLISSNPFERLNPVPLEGQGLNPLLQDPGLAFHPPTLYIGYVGLSVAFSFAIGALFTREVGPAFAKAMRPWVLGAWMFLTRASWPVPTGPITNWAGAAGGSGTRWRTPA